MFRYIVSLFFLLCISHLLIAGDKFTKLGAFGESLPDVASYWSCVKHVITGQVWQVKTIASKDETHLLDNVPTYIAKLKNIDSEKV